MQAWISVAFHVVKMKLSWMDWVADMFSGQPLRKSADISNAGHSHDVAR